MNKEDMSKITGVLSTMRKCNGIIIETLTIQPERSIILDALKYFKENGYNVYSLRHKENDMSLPYEVCKDSILVNRFGWFVTKDTMKFNKNIYHNSSLLNVNNVNYYTNNDDYRSCKIELVEYAYDCSVSVSLNDFIDNYDTINTTMKNVRDEFIQNELKRKVNKRR